MGGGLVLDLDGLGLGGGGVDPAGLDSRAAEADEIGGLLLLGGGGLRDEKRCCV